jgi:hypothetical protein
MKKSLKTGLAAGATIEAVMAAKPVQALEVREVGLSCAVSASGDGSAAGKPKKIVVGSKAKKQSGNKTMSTDDWDTSEAPPNSRQRIKFNPLQLPPGIQSRGSASTAGLARL